MAEGLDIKRGDVQCAVTCDTCDNTAEHYVKHVTINSVPIARTSI